MARPPKPQASAEEAIALALFAQRSPHLGFRERAGALALAALSRIPDFEDLRPLAEFAARSSARGASAEAARDIGRRLLGEAGHAELWSQLTGSASRQRDHGPRRAPRTRPERSGR